jgi:hypothetical protein
VAHIERSAKMRALFPLIALLSLVGCASIPKQMVAQFDAQNGDFIVIKKDAAVHWSPPSKTRDRLVFVGIASPKKSEPLVVPPVVPSSSPFLYSKLIFSADFSRVTVDWGEDLSKRAQKSATEYVRQH